jgi:hypothetical protein
VKSGAVTHRLTRNKKNDEMRRREEECREGGQVGIKETREDEEVSGGRSKDSKNNGAPEKRRLGNKNGLGNRWQSREGVGEKTESWSEAFGERVVYSGKLR